MAKRVLVTGLGIITSIGKNVEENLDALLESRPGIGEIRRLRSIHGRNMPAGEIRMEDEELAALLGINYQAGMTRTSLLGMVAAAEAVRASGFAVPGSRFAVISHQSSVVSRQSSVISRQSSVVSRQEPGTRNQKPGTRNQKLETRNPKPETDPSGCAMRTGLISGSTVGGMVATEKYYPDWLENDSHNEWIDGNDCSDSTERIAQFLGISDFVSTINTACSSSANAIMTGTRMIRAGLLDRAVVGGTDALCIFTLNGFNTLMIYDKEPCKPFDRFRNGLNLGEGAAYLVLESEEALGSRTPLCEVTGYGNSTDAFHQTALSPEGKGPYLSMKAALDRSGLMPEQISYVNAHGTATVNNDLSESVALMKIFGNQMPPVSSTKPFTGHLLGASGAVEAVYSVLSILHGYKWPNLNFRQPMEEMNFEPIPKLIAGAEVRHVLSNSFGFGGNNTSLIFSKL